jgi:hypothetical protein
LRPPAICRGLATKRILQNLYEPKDEKEINTLRTRKRVSPKEEAKWYEQYSQTFNPQDYNCKLQRMVLDKYPDLVSSGETAVNTLIVGKQMSTMGINAPDTNLVQTKITVKI